MDETMVDSEYVTAVGDVYYEGDSQSDPVKNYIVRGIDEPLDCYITCLSHHSGRCLSFRYCTLLQSF